LPVIEPENKDAIVKAFEKLGRGRLSVLRSSLLVKDRSGKNQPVNGSFWSRIVHGKSRVSCELAVEIDRLTFGAVPVRILRPDIFGDIELRFLQRSTPSDP